MKFKKFNFKINISKNKAKKIAILSAIVLLSLIAVVMIAFIILSSHYYGLMNYETLPPDDGEHMEIPDEELESILAELETDDEYLEELDPDFDPDFTDGSETSNSNVNDPSNPNPGTTAPPVTETAAKPPVPPTLVPDGDDVRHILLIGSDYTGKNGLSDIMVIASINETEKTITCTSLMRDTYAYIPVNKGIYKKLNVAHSIGGVSLLKKTIEKNFGIKVDNYMRVGFDEAVAVFDNLGGLNIKLDKDEINYIKNKVPNSTLSFNAAEADSNGYVSLHLNGEELRAHARNRSTGGRVDFNRTRRQREILEAAFNKAKTMSISDLTTFLSNALPLVTTDISYSDFLSYVLSAPSYASYKFQSFRIPSDGNWKYWKVYVLITNTEKTMKEWYNLVYN